MAEMNDAYDYLPLAHRTSFRYSAAQPGVLVWWFKAHRAFSTRREHETQPLQKFFDNSVKLTWGSESSPINYAYYAKSCPQNGRERIVTS